VPGSETRLFLLDKNQRTMRENLLKSMVVLGRERSS